MDTVIIALKTVMAGFLAVLCAFVGGFDGMIIALAIFMLVDFIFGMAHAFQSGTFKAEEMYKGILKKVLVFFVIGISNVIDLYLLPTGGLVRLGTILLYAGYEGMSIIENMGLLGLPVPKVLKDALEVLRDKSESIDIKEKVKEKGKGKEQEKQEEEKERQG